MPELTAVRETTSSGPIPESNDGKRVRFRVRDLNSWYGDTQVLKNVSLDIFDREIMALIGPSGCGKSTFLRCLNRMNDLVPGFRATGSIELDGRDIMARDVDLPQLRASVGMVFQHPNPFPMSVYDNIAMAVKYHNPHLTKEELDQIVEDSLRHANLWEEMRQHLKRSAFSISGGQQQRLCIARALAVRPEILMLDEPCASLDPFSTGRIEELLLQLASELPIVIVTHNLAQAKRISDRLAFFLMGELVEAGPAERVLKAPRSEQTRQYLEGMYG